MSKPEGPAPGYRPGVGIMLINARGEVFVGRRAGYTDDAWQMPQGGIDEGEKPRRAALRELAEEIGTDKAEIIAESSAWLDYDLPEEAIGKRWGGRYRGQSQKWFLARFTGEDADIDLTAHHPEFDAWRWLPAERLAEVVIPFKRAVYQRVVAEFAPLIAAASRRRAR